MIAPETADRIRYRVNSAAQVLVLSHFQPDGDSIGSTTALCLGIEQWGKKIVPVLADNIPENYLFVSGLLDFRRPENVEFRPGTLYIYLDCADAERIGFNLPGAVDAADVINIDHHISNTNFGGINLVSPTASATGEIVYELLSVWGVPITPSIARALYTAIVTDTGSFQYDSTTGATLRIAAELLDLGADLRLMREQLWESKPLAAINLLKIALNSLHLEREGSIAWTKLSRDDLALSGATEEHAEGLVNYARSIKRVEIALLFREVEKDLVKVAFRSKSYADVNLIVQKFNGGGHQRASGCTVHGFMDDVIAMVVKAASDHLDSLVAGPLP